MSRTAGRTPHQPAAAQRGSGEPDGRESRWAWVPRRAPIEGAPWLPRGCLPRRALWTRLDASTERAVTMVVAPAGAGKTLGVAGWLQDSPRGDRARWVNADRSLDVAGLEALLGPPGRRGTEEARLVVVDDAHRLPSSSMRYIDERLNADPEALRLVLVSRWDLPLSRLVPELLGHLSVLRGDVLRLSPPETGRLVAEHARTESAEVIDAIADRADGWCAAVVLAARASAAAPSRRDFLRRCRNGGSGIADLVASEVFASLRPRERHLLLCVALERTVTTDTAVHLTRDAGAGEVLATLESTGLLVNRVGSGRVEAEGDDDPPDGSARFRIHPLLREVTRRRLVAGGVDVLQARATVRRAARLDLAHGHTSLAFRRLVALGEHDAAARVLADDGPRLISDGQARAIDVLVREAGGTIEARPDTWTAIAWARWASADSDSAAHWAGRVAGLLARDPAAVPAVQAACVRLLRSRAGAAPVAEAVAAARALLGDDDVVGRPDPYLSLLLCELGAAENWLGDLTAAEHHLSDAVLRSRGAGMATLAAGSLSHLALTQFMAGREMACHDLAAEALEALAGCDADEGMIQAIRARAATVLRLVELQSGPWSSQPADDSTRTAAPGDLAVRFWQRILASRLALSGGLVAESRRLLERPFEGPPLPVHLTVSLQMDRAAHALFTGDRQVLRRIAGELEALGAPGEGRWVAAAAADLDGDLRLAASLHVEASRVECRAQPPTRALGLVCAAQLHDRLGEPDAAAVLLAEGMALTQARRSMLPFLGWSTHGTPVGRLLAAPGVEPSEWSDELRTACGDRPPIVSAFRSLVATQQELGSVPATTIGPMLSPREHEVLQELARGATYADIAANLFVSQNTVKTHISSLYAKLSVGRRSEALAVARKAHLL